MHLPLKNRKKLKQHTAFVVLGPDDKLRKSDLCRHTYYPGYTDSVFSDLVDQLNWGRVEDRLPGWIGKTFRDYLSFNKPKGYVIPEENFGTMEFIRKVPVK